MLSSFYSWTLRVSKKSSPAYAEDESDPVIPPQFIFPVTERPLRQQSLAAPLTGGPGEIYWRLLFRAVFGSHLEGGEHNLFRRRACTMPRLAEPSGCACSLSTMLAALYHFTVKSFQVHPPKDEPPANSVIRIEIIQIPYRKCNNCCDTFSKSSRYNL